MVTKPKYQCGDWVYKELKLKLEEIPGEIDMTVWKKFFVAGINIKDSSDEPYWLYDLVLDPPAPYYPGKGWLNNVSEQSLYSLIPSTIEAA